MSRKPTRANLCIIGQLCKLIPGYLVPKLAREYGVEERARTFTPWSHLVAMLYAQLAHSLSLNDVCDALKTHSSLLSTIRQAVFPSRNALSHANRERDCQMAENLFYQLYDHFMSICPNFRAHKFQGMPRRFKRTIYALDSTVIVLVANCIDWAKHRRRKAAAKLHLRLNLQSFLPAFAIVDTAAHHDAKRARELCAGLQAGEIAVFDKAYNDLRHLLDLTSRGVFWVTRAKDNLQYRVVKKLVKKPTGTILSDQVVALTGRFSRRKYPERLRVVRAIVEVDGKLREMTFLTNNVQWAPSTIADLYKYRWLIEVFFKEIKQTLKLCDFLGHNRNAVAWQVWTALILYLLLRFSAYCNSWQHGFRRFFCLLRSCLWERVLVKALVARCGTAGGTPPWHAAPHQLYLPGFEPC